MTSPPHNHTAQSARAHTHTMQSLRAPPHLTGGTGYPVLAAPDPPEYGALNPRPAAGDVQANNSAVPSGTLFGEFVSANADASLFQPNIAPDVITVAVHIPDCYFGGNQTKLQIPPGTPVLLGEDIKRDTWRKQRTAARRATEDVGKIHCGVFGRFINMHPFTEWTEDQIAHIEQVRQKATYATVLVGPADVVKGRVAFLAVALQNVAHVSYANIQRSKSKPMAHSIGTIMYLGCEVRQLPTVQVGAFPEGPQRELRSILPLTLPMLATASFDVGTHMP